jgi:hypothetical protein
LPRSFGPSAFGLDHLGFAASGALGFAAAVAGGFGEGGQLFYARGFGDFIRKALAGGRTVCGLGAGIGRCDADPGWDVAECDGGGDFVHVLAARAAGAREALLNIDVSQQNHIKPSYSPGRRKLRSPWGAKRPMFAFGARWSRVDSSIGMKPTLPVAKATMALPPLRKCTVAG